MQRIFTLLADIFGVADRDGARPGVQRKTDFAAG